MALELVTFLGLALLLEGVFLALFPRAMKGMMAQVSALTSSQLRNVGLIFAGLAALLLVILGRVYGGDEGGGLALAFPSVRAFMAGLL